MMRDCISIMLTWQDWLRVSAVSAPTTTTLPWTSTLPKSTSWALTTKSWSAPFRKPGTKGLLPVATTTASGSYKRMSSPSAWVFSSTWTWSFSNMVFCHSSKEVNSLFPTGIEAGIH